MRVVLIGAVHATCAALAALHRPGIELQVFGLDPSRAGRHSDYCDLAAVARELGVPSRQITDVNAPEVLQALRSIAPDLICVFGWSQLVGPELRGEAKVGVLGWHPSPLPENRGRAVIPWSILQRRTSTAMSIFWIDGGTDTGDIAAQVEIPMAPDETATTLYAKVEAAGAHAVELLLAQGAPASWPRHPQEHARATSCARRIPEDGRIDWTRPAEEIWTLVRASTRPYPGAFTTFEGHPLQVWEAELVHGARHSATPGQVVERQDSALVVACGDRHALRLTDWTIAVPTEIRSHDRLGDRADPST